VTSKPSSKTADRTRKPRPAALKVAPAERYGSTAGWYMGVVLQQACQAMVRRGN